MNKKGITRRINPNPPDVGSCELKSPTNQKNNPPATKLVIRINCFIVVSPLEFDFIRLSPCNNHFLISLRQSIMSRNIGVN